MHQWRGRRRQARSPVRLVEASPRPPDRRQREGLQTAALWLLVVLGCAVIGYCALHWQLDLAFVIAPAFGL